LYEKILKLAPFNSGMVSHIMYQILSVIYYCHNINIIHRDLKPENILINCVDKSGMYNIKIIDFGTAKIFREGEFEKKVIGSSYYIAPEVLSQNYTEKCDLWSCGVILYILLSGRAPFDGNNDEEILEKIKKGNYKLTGDKWDNIDKNSKDLIKKLLEMDPEKRISAQEALNHPFFEAFVQKRRKSVPTQKILGYISNFQKYQPDFKLQQAVLAFIVHNMPKNDEMRDLVNLFQILDEDSDGRLTKEDLKRGVERLLNNNQLYTEVDIDTMFSTADADNSGFIDYEEFIRACMDKEKILTETNLKFAFSFFDKDNSGHITIEELEVVFCGNGKNSIDKNVLKEIVEEADINKDGQISFNEFKVMMMSNILKK